MSEKLVTISLSLETANCFHAIGLLRTVLNKEKIEAYESTLSSSQSQEISTSDSLTHVLGIKEHCGHVRGLGLGPCPSKVFGVHAGSHRGSSSASASNIVELQTCF
ncbi:hypothetical protein V8G54_011294 [Vigna mungo]|uniref:Uncharacterized protein n=1 Tax=Vigna mungo TaxID=3915 RepID=A0AAQ3S261_VIGMU